MMGRQTGHVSARVRELPGTWKAVTILNVLDAPTLEKLVKYLDHEDIARIRSLDMELEPVAAEEFAAIIEEFASRFVRRLRMVGDYRSPEGILEEVLDPDELERLTGGGDDGPPVWEDERFAAPEVLQPLVEREHPQMAAFLLSRMDPDLGAGVMKAVEEGRRNEILLRMLDMRPVSPGVTMVVEQHIRVSFIEDTSAARNAEARARIASIVNRMDKELAEQFLEALKQARPEEAKEIKRMLFSFEDIVRLSEKDRLVLFDKVPAELTIKALHGVSEELVNMVLEALGGRMRKMVEAELSAGNPPPEEEAVEARREIAAMALELAAAGEIVIEDGEEA